MIVFDLLCGDGHRFEGWFKSAADFSAQKKHRILECPTCGTAKVDRVPSAARLNFGAQEKAKAPEKTPEMEGKDPFAIAQMLYSKMIDELLTKSEDVGKEFPAEARKIFYEQAPARPIRGQATEEEHEELLDESLDPAAAPPLKLPLLASASLSDRAMTTLLLSPPSPPSPPSPLSHSVLDPAAPNPSRPRPTAGSTLVQLASPLSPPSPPSPPRPAVELISWPW